MCQRSQAWDSYSSGHLPEEEVELQRPPNGSGARQRCGMDGGSHNHLHLACQRRVWGGWELATGVSLWPMRGVSSQSLSQTQKRSSPLKIPQLTHRIQTSDPSPLSWLFPHQDGKKTFSFLLSPLPPFLSLYCTTQGIQPTFYNTINGVSSKTVNHYGVHL